MIFEGNVKFLMLPSVLIGIILVKLQNTFFFQCPLQLIYGIGLRASMSDLMNSVMLSAITRVYS